jgi:two-component sensor histidine kinase
MINHSIKNIKIIFLLFTLFNIYANANIIDISKSEQFSILEKSSVYFEKNQSNIQEILKNNLFKPYIKPYINIGASQKTIWIRLQLHNPTQQPVEKLLIFTSSLLEDIALYKEGNLDSPIIKGVSNITEAHTTLFPYYKINLDKNSSVEYYLRVKSFYEPVDFGLKIENKNRYISRDRTEQFVNIMLIGMVLALMLYSFLVSFYTKDKSYRYYSFYLFFLVYQQLTYLGLTQIYFPVYFVHMDIAIPMIKINLLIITSALFGIHFLKIHQKSILHKIYKLFIIIAIIEILILSIPNMYNLDIVILTGALFIIFNLFAGIFSYIKGYKQARLFILGFTIVFASYVLMILDALGITSIMQDFQNILMFSTAFEALILSLAFADRYIILQDEKEKVDARILQETKNRASIIEAEVIEKTRELNLALDTKELLIKEIHHRVKNNLQIILSMLRLENDEIEDSKTKDKLTSLEHRINAIAKTYTMLLSTDNLEKIDMKNYIETLLLDISEAYDFRQHHIDTITDIDAIIPLKQSVYIGLIINELVTNTYKYAFSDKRGTITVSFKKEKEEENYILIIEDNGKGFVLDDNSRSLGSKLIKTLIYDQLEGNMEIFTNCHTKYIIRFTI